jgi:uncharacterized protein
MSAEQNKQSAKDGYDAFESGDTEKAMANISDSIEWVVGGDSAVTGTYHGKAEVGQFWGQLAEKGFEGNASEFIADGDKVAVLTNNSVGGDQTASVDILTYDGGGQLVRFESYGGEQVLDRVFPR